MSCVCYEMLSVSRARDALYIGALLALLLQVNVHAEQPQFLLTREGLAG